MIIAGLDHWQSNLSFSLGVTHMEENALIHNHMTWLQCINKTFSFLTVENVSNHFWHNCRHL
jgi:hypothetical protein